MKKLLLTLATAFLYVAFCSAQQIKFTTTKAIGERIYFTITSDGGFTIEGAEGETKDSYAGYTLTSKEVTLKGKILEISAIYNGIDAVDATQMPGLRVLDIYGNPIKTLDLSANKELTILVAGGTEITSLDLTNCEKLQQLNVNSCKIPSIDFSKNSNLEIILARSAGFKELNLNGLSSIDILDCSYNNLGKLDLSVVPTLTQLSCAGNNISELDITGVQLEVLNCNDNNLKTIDFTGQSSLQEVGCIKNKIESLDMTDCTSLYRLMLFSNNMRHTAMTKLVESLPTVFEIEGCFTSVDLRDAAENNEMSKGNVSIMRSKNWEVYNYDGGTSFDEFGIVYEGEDDDKLSISNVSEAPFKLYATSENIYIEGAVAGTEVTVSDMSGAVVIKTSARTGLNVIPVSDMPSGIYVVTIGNDSIKIMKK